MCFFVRGDQKIHFGGGPKTFVVSDANTSVFSAPYFCAKIGFLVPKNRFFSNIMKIITFEARFRKFIRNMRLSNQKSTHKDGFSIFSKIMMTPWQKTAAGRGVVRSRGRTFKKTAAGDHFLQSPHSTPEEPG